MTSQRRARGDGGLRLRPDGYWEATLSLGYVGGKRRRRSFTGRSQAEARRKRDDWLRDNRGQTLLGADGSVTLDTWFERHVATVRPVTAIKYRSAYVHHVKPWLGDMPLTDIQDVHVERVVDKALLSGLSPNSTITVYKVLSAVLQSAYMRKKIGHNPARLVTPPQSVDVEYTIFDVDQIGALLTALEGHRYLPVATVIAYTGLRISEASGLLTEHVRLDDQRIDVRWRAVPVKGGWDWERCKSKTSRRTVPVLPAAHKALLQAEEQGQQVAAPPPHDGSLMAFSTVSGRPLRENHFNHVLKQACREAGLPEVKPHELRHSAGSFMLSAGVPLWTVSRLLGHSSQAVTEKVYAHMLDSGTDAAAKALADYMKGTT